MGRLVRDQMHPDQHPTVPLGAWCDAVWSIYFELGLQFRASEQMDAFTEVWDELNARAVVDEPGPVDERGRSRPSPEEMASWGADRRAQAGAANLAQLMGGSLPGSEG